MDFEIAVAILATFKISYDIISYHIVGLKWQNRLEVELREQLVEVWAGLQQNVIDDAIDQWRRRLPACMRSGGLEEDILSICCDCISYLGYGS